MKPSGSLERTGLPPHHVVGICGFKNSGKTTLIEQLIPRLREGGLRIAVIKHDTHGIEVDRPGKDSDRFFRAGADVLLQGVREEMFRAHPGGSGGLHAWLGELTPRYDLILVEGHKTTPLPKVWLKDGEGTPPPPEAGNILLELPMEADRVEAMTRFLEERLRSMARETALFGCILIGGRSRRMSQPKHLIEEDGRTWIERIADRLGKAVREIVIVGDGVLPGSLEGMPRLSDVPGVHGPMAGLLAAMRWNPRASWLVTACDMPGISRAALEWLKAARRPGVWAILPSLAGAAGEVEPLLAYYDFRARHLLETAVQEGDFMLKHLAAGEKVITPSPPAKLIRAWWNINSPEDLQAYRASLDWDH